MRRPRQRPRWLRHPSTRYWAGTGQISLRGCDFTTENRTKCYVAEDKVGGDGYRCDLSLTHAQTHATSMGLLRDLTQVDCVAARVWATGLNRNLKLVAKNGHWSQNLNSIGSSRHLSGVNSIDSHRSTAEVVHTTGLPVGGPRQNGIQLILSPMYATFIMIFGDVRRCTNPRRGSMLVKEECAAVAHMNTRMLYRAHSKSARKKNIRN